EGSVSAGRRMPAYILHPDQRLAGSHHEPIAVTSVNVTAPQGAGTRPADVDLHLVDALDPALAECLVEPATSIGVQHERNQSNAADDPGYVSRSRDDQCRFPSRAGR